MGFYESYGSVVPGWRGYGGGSTPGRAFIATMNKLAARRY